MTPFLTKVYFRALDTLRSVSAWACPIVGFVARLQIPLPHTRAVGPRVRGLHVGVALDLFVRFGALSDRATFRPLNGIHPAYAPQES